jgi:hypothetical protein
VADHDDTAVDESSVRRSRWTFVFVCWAAITLSSVVAPLLLIFWPISALACGIVLIGALDDLPAHLRRRDHLDPATSRRVKAWFAVIALAAGFGTLSAYVPSMGWLSKSGVLRYEYSLSRVIAPAAFAVLGIVVVHALRSLSVRRVSIVIAAILFTWPFLLAIRVLREPWFDIDNQFVLLAPWATYGYAASLALASVGALSLAITCHRLVALPERRLPPEAKLVRPS